MNENPRISGLSGVFCGAVRQERILPFHAMLQEPAYKLQKNNDLSRR